MVPIRILRTATLYFLLFDSRRLPFKENNGFPNIFYFGRTVTPLKIETFEGELTSFYT